MYGNFNSQLKINLVIPAHAGIQLNKSFLLRKNFKIACCQFFAGFQTFLPPAKNSGMTTARGFTLVELSIALVIIGLLIGGILVGQKILAATKIQNYVSQLQQYEIAVTGFKNKFKYEPGDAPHFTPPGNSNGILNGAGCNSTPGYTTYSGIEGNQVWGHLVQAGMLKAPYVSWAPSTCLGTQGNDSRALAGSVFPVFSQSSIYGTLVGSSVKKTPLYYDVTSTYKRYYSFTPPLEVMALENKMDNNNNATGNFISYVYASGTLCSAYIASGGNPDTSLCTWWWYVTH